MLHKLHDKIPIPNCLLLNQVLLSLMFLREVRVCDWEGGGGGGVLAVYVLYITCLKNET